MPFVCLDERLAQAASRNGFDVRDGDWHAMKRPHRAQTEKNRIRGCRRRAAALLAAGTLGGCATLIGPPVLGPADFAGVWRSPEWGEMTLRAAGARVVGDYVHEGGQLDCAVQANVLRCRWWENVAPGQGCTAAEVTERGEVEFTLSDDRTHLGGRWRYDWRTDWTATRAP